MVCVTEIGIGLGLEAACVARKKGQIGHRLEVKGLVKVKREMTCPAAPILGSIIEVLSVK